MATRLLQFIMIYFVASACDTVGPSHGGSPPIPPLPKEELSPSTELVVAWPAIGAIPSTGWSITTATERLQKDEKHSPTQANIPIDQGLESSIVTLNFATEGMHQITINLLDAKENVRAALTWLQAVGHEPTMTTQNVVLTKVSTGATKLNPRDVTGMLHLNPVHDPNDDSTAPTVSYEEDIFPLLEAHCIRCHKPAARGGGLDLSTLPFTSVLREEESPEELGRRVIHAMKDTRYPMPPGDPRPQEEITLFEKWLNQDTDTSAPPKAPPANSLYSKLQISFRLQSLQANHKIVIPLQPETLVYKVIFPGLTPGESYVFDFSLLDEGHQSLFSLEKTYKIPPEGDITIPLDFPALQGSL